MFSFVWLLVFYAFMDGNNLCEKSIGMHAHGYIWDNVGRLQKVLQTVPLSFVHIIFTHMD